MERGGACRRRAPWTALLGITLVGPKDSVAFIYAASSQRSFKAFVSLPSNDDETTSPAMFTDIGGYNCCKRFNIKWCDFAYVPTPASGSRKVDQPRPDPASGASEGFGSLQRLRSARRLNASPSKQNEVLVKSPCNSELKFSLVYAY